MENNKTTKEPFYKKATAILIGTFLFFYMLPLLEDLLIPLAFAALFAILLSPLYNKFIEWRIPKVFSIILTLSVAIIVIADFFYFLSSQLLQFGEMLPALKLKFRATLHELEALLLLCCQH